MLSEITIKDFAIIDQLRLQFAPGFNVLTGETGAGKSIILDAVTLLLGGRASNEDIRTGTSQTLIEGTFQLSEGSTKTVIDTILEREGLEGDSPDLLILSREVRRGDRNICRVNGRTVTLAVLQEVSEAFIDIHGQSEHLSLLKPQAHLGLLDRYGGLEKQRESFAALVRQIEGVRRDLHDLTTNEDARKQRAEMLRQKVADIDAANLRPDEEETLAAEAKLLANAEQLADLVTEASRALFASQGEGFSAADLVNEAASALARLGRIDPETKDLAELAESVSIQIEELGRSLSDYEESVEANPQRLQEAELRLDFIKTLKRRYRCESIEELIQAGEAAQMELESLDSSSDRIEELQAEEARLLAEIGRAGQVLSKARSKVAGKLGEAVEAELNDLKMENAKFSVSITHVDDTNGAPVDDYRVRFDHTGIDQVEFMLAPNVGEPLKPMARIASGGETSRIMLALKTVLSRADETPTLIFDEIDAGIGGRIGAVVGQKLWSLASSHQILVVTHLPQLAGFADAHYKVEKAVTQGRTIVKVDELAADQRVEEITAMLGAESESARQNAEELLGYVKRIKRQAASAPSI